MCRYCAKEWCDQLGTCKPPWKNGVTELEKIKTSLCDPAETSGTCYNAKNIVQPVKRHFNYCHHFFYYRELILVIVSVTNTFHCLEGSTPHTSTVRHANLGSAWKTENLTVTDWFNSHHVTHSTTAELTYAPICLIFWVIFLDDRDKVDPVFKLILIVILKLQYCQSGDRRSSGNLRLCILVTILNINRSLRV